MKNLAVIPARGGSKRIPRKNIKLFKNKPMIAWSIEAAFNSSCFDEVLVSTDDEEIARIAKDYGANVPFVRPKELSDDYATTQEVIEHSIKWLLKKNIFFDNVCCIYATAPLVQVKDLKDALLILEKSIDDIYVFVATSYPFSIFRSIFIDEKGYSSMLYPENFYQRSQDLKEAYHDAGQFYWSRIRDYAKESMFGQSSIPIILPSYLVQDIDSEDDWVRAEIMYKVLLETNERK